MANFVLGVASGPNRSPGPLSADFKTDSGSSFNLEQTSFEEDDMYLTLRSRNRPSLRSNSDQQQASSLPSTPLTSRKAFSQGTTKDMRHYKKDSRFVLDLYTLTFDENETVDDVGPILTKNQKDFIDNIRERHGGGPGYMSMMLTPKNGLRSSEPLGPMSLNLSNQSPSFSKPNSLPTLETNLHKILARKIQDSEEVSFKKAKLLTKAYYKLLRESNTPVIDPQVYVQHLREEASRTKRIGSDRLDWQTLLSTDKNELRRIVGGLGNTVKALNEYLVDLLVERDELLGKQDDLLEEISEMTDNLL